MKNCRIVVGSPGRVKNLIEAGILQTKYLKMFILDEADKLFSEDFRPTIE
jgi:translation initiation factor 4A